MFSRRRQDDLFTNPPKAPREDYVRDVHGVRTNDPYYWMRDHADPRLVEYLRAERDYFEVQRQKLQGIRSDVEAEAIERAAPGGRRSLRLDERSEYFLESSHDRHPIVWRQDIRNGNRSLVLDYNALAQKTGFARTAYLDISPDGRWLAYALDTDGSESYELHIQSLVDEAGVVRYTHGQVYEGFAWGGQGAHLYFTTHDHAHRPYRIHRVATDRLGETPDLVYEEPDQRFHMHLGMTASAEWITLTGRSRTTSEVHILPATGPAADTRCVEPRRDGIEYLVHHFAGRSEFLILTNDSADEYRLVSAPVGRPERNCWREVVPETTRGRLWSVGQHSSECLALTYRTRNGLQVVVTNGATETLVLEPDSQAGHIEYVGSDSDDGQSLLVRSESLVDPGSVYSVNMKGERVRKQKTSISGYTPSNYETRRLWVTSSNGASVPLDLTYRRGIRMDGTNPCTLYVYGSYEVVTQRRFSPEVASLLDRGVVFGIAGVRGGGEVGRRWWREGSMLKKRNTLKDLIACNEFLVAHGWAHPDRIAVRGKCAGGLIAASAYTFYPSHWAGVVAEVPSVDLLNSMLDPLCRFTIEEWEEFGNPAASRKDYDNLVSYVPYENIHDLPRPPLLVTAIYGDTRILVHKPAKWVAALREADTHGNSILFYPDLETRAHQSPTLEADYIRYEAEVAAFTLSCLDTSDSAEQLGESS